MLNVKYLKLLPKTEIIEREKNFNRFSRDQFFICLLFIFSFEFKSTLLKVHKKRYIWCF